MDIVIVVEVVVVVTGDVFMAIMLISSQHY